MSTREFAACDLEVSQDNVLATLGRANGRRVSGRLRRQIDEAIRGIRERAESRSVYRSYPMRIETGRVRVGESTVFRSARLAQALGPCRRVFVYVVTLGAEVDTYVRYWMQRRADFGIVADAAASAAAESLVDRMEEDISERLAPSQALSLPFSPGHCDWSIREQERLFALLPPHAAGVRLSDESMMSPRKSISGVLGAGPVAAVTQTANPCSSCPNLDCGHRRRPYAGKKNEGLPHEHPARTQRGRAASIPVRAAFR